MARALLVIASRRLGAAVLLLGVGVPAVFAAAAPPAPTHMRSTVRGRVTLQERGGVRTTDLENAVVWLEPLDAAAGSAAAPLATVPGISMESRRFRPMVRVVTPGSQVPFPNDDPFRHNVFSNAGPAAFDLGLYGRGEARRATFARAGVYPIFCNIHARMVAYVVAVPTRWHAQAAGDGSFEIAGVPAGRWRLHAWHDRGGQRSVELTVGAAPAAADVALDARNWRPVPHRNKFGQAYPPESHDRY
jgi:plastocyanin